MKKPVLEISSLKKVFPGKDGPLTAIDNISLSVSQSEFICILGPSGCGKTTLLQLIAGLMQATSGTIKLAGKGINEPHPDIGIVFQKPNLMPWRTVRENVLLPLEIAGIKGREAVKKAEEIITTVGLKGFEDHYPKALSGGMEQRVSVARALVRHPKILLLDEPFSALDAMIRDRMNMELLSLWRTQKITAIMVTHSIREAVMVSDRIIVLSARPAVIAKEYRNKLPRPRFEDIEFTHEFTDLAYKIKHSVSNEDEKEEVFSG